MGKQGKPLRKKSALPPQHSDSSSPLQGDERAATSGQRGAGTVQLDVRLSQGQQQGVNVMYRVTFPFFSPPHIHKHYPGCKVKNQKRELWDLSGLCNLNSVVLCRCIMVGYKYM